MALTSTIDFDLIGATQKIIFYNPSQIDEIIYSSNQVTFQMAAAYTLSKNDFLLYYKYLSAFITQLLINFPLVSASLDIPWPICRFDITESNSGGISINYIQSTGSATVIHIHYAPITSLASFSRRTSPVTISNQEFFMFSYMMKQYAKQVGLN